jgi:hypothetical protein
MAMVGSKQIIYPGKVLKNMRPVVHSNFVMFLFIANIIMTFASLQAAQNIHCDINTGNIDYRLNVAKNNIQGKEHIKSIGLVAKSTKKYSKRGWYHNAFIKISIDNKNLFDAPVEISTGNMYAAFTFRREKGEAKLIFKSSMQSDKLFCILELPQSYENLSVALCAYPGNFNKDDLSLNQRCISTSGRDAKAPGALTLFPDEAWVYYYDLKNNPQGNPFLSTCAMLYNPKQTSEVNIQMTNYAVKTNLIYKTGLKSVHFIFWEFPGMDNLKAIKYLKTLKIEYSEKQ